MWLLILLWLVFGISHSLLAATKVRAFFETLTPNKPHIFRLIYNGIALILLLLIVLKTFKTNTHLVSNNYLIVQLMGFSMLLMGLFILFGVAKQMDLKAFLGFKSESLGGELMTGGWYKIVRHPLYLGTLSVIIGLLLLVPTVNVLISVVFSQLYVALGIEFEEQKLRRIFGQTYMDYSKGKKKFIPFIY